MGNDNSSIAKAGSAGIQQYGDFDLGAMEEVEKALPSGGGNFYEPKEGKNVIRFLPPLQGKKAVVVYYKHFFQAGGERKSVICTKMQFNQHCPLCERRLKLAASSSRADQKMARAYEPSAKVCANVVDRKNPEKGVQVFRISPGLFKKIRKAIDMADVGKVFADPERGFDIVFGKSGSGLNTEYDPVAVARESTPLPDADDLIRSQPDLEQLEAAPSDEEQEEALDGEFEATESRKRRGSDSEGGRGGGGRGGRGGGGGGVGVGAGGRARGTDDADIEY